MKRAKQTKILVLMAVWIAVGIGASSAKADVLDAKFLAMRMTPNPISTNQKGKAYFQVQNTGTSTWDASNYRLKVFIFRAPSGGSTERDDLVPEPSKLRLAAITKPGEKAEFFYDYIGPDWIGDYVLKVTMAKGNAEFGDAETVNLRVLAGQFDSRLEYRDITIQSAKKAGSNYEIKRNDSYTVKINLQNSGQALWQLLCGQRRSRSTAAQYRTEHSRWEI